MKVLKPRLDKISRSTTSKLKCCSCATARLASSTGFGEDEVVGDATGMPSVQRLAV
jgi:hypothetical protein